MCAGGAGMRAEYAPDVRRDPPGMRRESAGDAPTMRSKLLSDPGDGFTAPSRAPHGAVAYRER
jgi:hypothetical protein